MARTISGGITTDGAPARFARPFERRAYARPPAVPSLPQQAQVPPGPTAADAPTPPEADQLPLRPGGLHEYLHGPSASGAPEGSEQHERERHGRLVSALADRSVPWGSLTWSDIEHAHRQLARMDTTTLWRLFEHLSDQNRGDPGLHGAEVVRRHLLHERDPAPEAALRPENEHLAWGFDGSGLEPAAARRLARLVQSLPPVRNVPPEPHGLPGAVFAPSGLNLRELLRGEFPDLQAWPLTVSQRRAAYGMPAAPERYAAHAWGELPPPAVVRPPRPAPPGWPPPGPDTLPEVHEPHLAHARLDITRHGGDPGRLAALLDRLGAVPELARWLSDRYGHGDRLDAAKLATLYDYAAALAADPAAVRLLGSATSLTGLASALARHRAERGQAPPYGAPVWPGPADAGVWPDDDGGDAGAAYHRGGVAPARYRGADTD